jgi:hypothetical protein
MQPHWWLTKDGDRDCLWPDSRHYTYVNAGRIASRNPGFCFLKADWNRCGMTKSGLLVLERLPLSGVEK